MERVREVQEPMILYHKLKNKILKVNKSKTKKSQNVQIHTVVLISGTTQIHKHTMKTEKIEHLKWKDPHSLKKENIILEN